MKRIRDIIGQRLGILCLKERSQVEMAKESKEDLKDMEKLCISCFGKDF